MAQAETEKLTEILWGAALSRAVCTIAELDIADHIEAGSPQSVESLAGATGTHERSLYRILRFIASYGIFQEKDNRQFDHTPLSHCLRSDAKGSFRQVVTSLRPKFFSSGRPGAAGNENRGSLACTWLSYWVALGGSKRRRRACAAFGRVGKPPGGADFTCD